MEGAVRRQRGRWRLLGRLEPPVGADSLPPCCRSVPPPPLVLSARPVRTAGSAAWLSASFAGQAPFVVVRGRNGFAAPWGPGRKGQWAGAGLSSRSGPCGPAQPSPTPRRRWDAAGGAPRYREHSPAGGGSHSAVDLQGCWGPSALPAIPVAAGASAPGAQHGAPVLPTPPGFFWNRSAQREKFGSGFVYSSSAFNACLILNEGKCTELTSSMYSKFTVE